MSDFDHNRRGDATKGESRVEAPPREEILEARRASGQKPMIVSGLIRPLSAAPAAAREIVYHVERIAAQTQKALPKANIPPILLSYILTVVIPAFAVLLYFLLFATDQFAAEARFAVRSIDADTSENATGSGSASASGGGSFAFTASSQNAFIVTSYIRSRAIVDDLSKTLDLRALYRRPEADFWARLGRDASIDELVEYWSSMVTTFVDSNSGIVTVKVRAFRKQDALDIASALVAASEGLVNRLSDRARRDATAMAEKDVRKAFAAVQASLVELRMFRDKAGILDPGQATGEIAKLLNPLLGEKIKLESELFVAGREMDAGAPTLRVLRNRIETVDQQITALKGKLTSSSAGGTIAASLSRFEELELQKGLAERLYALAQADYDRAQSRANRQSVYLSVFVPPSLPQESGYPRRFAFSLLVFAGLTMVWAIVLVIWGSIEDHRL